MLLFLFLLLSLSSSSSSSSSFLEGTKGGHIALADAPANFRHEDYRLHVLDNPPMDARGRRNRYWLFVIPDPPDYPTSGRACGRMAFTSATLGGPYSYGGWLVPPTPSFNCLGWPGDVLNVSGHGLYFVDGWGQLYQANASAAPGLQFVPLGAMLTQPAPPPAFDDLHQIEFTFLLPTPQDPRVRLYHASYSAENHNPNASRADYGFKQAIGMYTFETD